MPQEFGVCPGHYTLTTAGRFFKKCQKFCQKMPKNRSWGTLSEVKCCPRRVQQKKSFSETNFICMNFIRLQGLAAGTDSGRNNELLSWSMEFEVRPKTEFSYVMFFELCWHSFGRFFVTFKFFIAWNTFWIICQNKTVQKVLNFM